MIDFRFTEALMCVVTCRTVSTEHTAVSDPCQFVLSKLTILLQRGNLLLTHLKYTMMRVLI